MITLTLKLDIAVLALLGVMIGLAGTYLMTSAYHPFASGGLIKNFFRVAVWVVTFRWRTAATAVRDTVSFGELNPEDRGKSLAGIYLLFVSFAVQTAAGILGILDAIRSPH